MRPFLLNHMLTYAFPVESHLKIRDLSTSLRIFCEKPWEKSCSAETQAAIEGLEGDVQEAGRCDEEI